MKSCCSSTMFFWLHAICLLVYDRGDAFILPSPGVVVRQAGGQRFSSMGVDDIAYFGAETSSLRESLDSMRNSISSMQYSIETTRHSLDATSITLSKGTSSIAEEANIDEAADILKEAMKQVKSSSDAGYFQASVGSMKDSLVSIQQSIEQVKEVHQVHNSVFSASQLADASQNVPILSNYVASKTHLQPVVEEVSRTGSNLIRDSIHNLESMNSAATAEYNNQLQQGMAKFLDSASSESVVMAANAKIKLSMMVTNTYLMLGLEPPESLARSGSPVTASVSLFAAFFAVLWAFGSKEMARKQTEDNFKIIIRDYEEQQAILRTQMVSTTIDPQ